MNAMSAARIAPSRGLDHHNRPNGSAIERRSLDFLPSRSAATIFQRRDGGPMRPVGRRRGIRPGGLYYSQKMGRLVGHESENEKCDLYRAEVRTDILSYREQPHTIEGPILGKQRRYTPDREDRFGDGRIEIVEVKDKFEADKDPDYTAKLSYFAEVYDRLGWSFRITTREEIFATGSFEAVEAIQRYRRVSYSIDEVIAVQEAFAGRRTCLLEELLKVFPTAAIARPKLYAMMVGRVVALDLSSKLEPSSTATLV
jgi:hypothetical protein